MKGLNVMYIELELDSEGNEEILKGSKQEVSNVATCSYCIFEKFSSLQN